MQGRIVYPCAIDYWDRSVFRNFLVIAALFGATGVMLGAFGAHGLRDLLTPERMNTYQTAVTYQMWHALALLGVSLVGMHLSARPNAGGLKSLTVSAYALTLGTLIFSGSLYLLVLLDIPMLGAITPLGGVALIIGWLSLAYAALQPKS